MPLAIGLDIAAMGTPAGMAFGRLGCFMNGCCHGGPCDPGFPLGVVFPVDSPAQIEQWEAGLLPARDSLPLPVHPVQLYQAAHDFALLALLVWYLRRPGIVKGSGMPLLFFMYGLGRFTLEFLRGDQKLTFSGLTVGQNVAILTFLAFGTILVVLLVRSRHRLIEPARILQKGG